MNQKLILILSVCFVIVSMLWGYKYYQERALENSNIDYQYGVYARELFSTEKSEPIMPRFDELNKERVKLAYYYLVLSNEQMEREVAFNLALEHEFLLVAILNKAMELEIEISDEEVNEKRDDNLSIYYTGYNLKGNEIQDLDVFREKADQVSRGLRISVEEYFGVYMSAHYENLVAMSKLVDYHYNELKIDRDWNEVRQEIVQEYKVNNIDKIERFIKEVGQEL